MTEPLDRPIDPGSRIAPPPIKESRWPILVTLISVLVGAVVLFGGYQFWERYQATSRVSALIQLHTDGWTNAELQMLAAQLEKLGPNSCDFRALEVVASTIQKKGNGADLATFYSSIIDRCPHEYTFAYQAWRAAQNSGDFNRSLAIANKFIAEEPVRATPRALRGQAYEALGELRLALGDYLSALELLGDKRRIVPSEYLRLARTFAKLDEYCSAVSILELYVSFDPSARRTPPIDTLINEYSAKGSCSLKASTTNVKGTKAGQHLIVTVSVNGSPGRLLVDTGATFTALSPALAEKAGVKFDGKEIQILGFGGISSVRMGKLPSLTVGSVTVSNLDVVPLAPTNTDSRGFDGLLGMNFLALVGFKLVEDRLELGKR
jgi:clan AA aspartic protease (TIGR02281 family)